MIKKNLIILYTFFINKINKNNIDLIKENTWKSKRTAKNFFNVHNKNKNIIFNEYISKYFCSKIKKKHKVLDVGCGTGRLTNLLLRKTNKVYGIDNSQEMLSYAPKRAKLFVGTAFKMPFKNNFFDIAVSMDLLVHFKNAKKIILEMKRVIKKNGYIIFNIGNKEHITFAKKIFGKNMNGIYDHTGTSLSKPFYNAITNKKISHLAKKNYLKVEKIVPYNFFQGNILLNSFCMNEKVISKFNAFIYKLYHNKLLSKFFISFEKKIVANLDIKFTFYKIVILKKIK
jgi:ubiquinone/menaquinone biosynthesis C-methylase UbiE